jgi:hypothetical protein
MKKKKTENGDDDDELFYVDDEEEEEEDATDDDYIGSDDESGLNTKDDPDDFVYQPGKKTPKKRTSMKRSRSRTSAKRKRGASTRTSKRGRKKSKVIVNKKLENEDLATVPTEIMQTNNQQFEKTENIQVDLNNLDTKSAEQTTTPTTDIIPTTS